MESSYYRPLSHNKILIENCLIEFLIKCFYIAILFLIIVDLQFSKKIASLNLHKKCKSYNFTLNYHLQTNPLIQLGRQQTGKSVNKDNRKNTIFLYTDNF